MMPTTSTSTINNYNPQPNNGVCKCDTCKNCSDCSCDCNNNCSTCPKDCNCSNCNCSNKNCSSCKDCNCDCGDNCSKCQNGCTCTNCNCNKKNERKSKRIMKAAYVHKNGVATSPAVISVADDLPVPEPKGGEILIKVHAAAINPVDWKLIEGWMPGLKKGPVGCDVSGVVVSIGLPTMSSSDFKVGDEVYGDIISTKGAFGEYCVAKANVLHKKPSNVNMQEAAALPLAGLTALQGLTTHGHLKKGQKVLILGGSGGVGSLAIQMAKALGASHVTATGSDVKLIQGFGADEVINYKEHNVKEALKDQQDFDLVFDTIGGYDHWVLAKACMKKKLAGGGQFVSIVGDGSSMMRTVMSLFWRKLAAKVFGGPNYTLFLTSTSAPDVENDMKKLTELVEKGAVKPVLDSTQYELTTQGVHDMIKASKSHRAKGKLILKVV